MRGTRKLTGRESEMTTITSKNGTEITLEIAGTQEEPKITAERFVIAGNTVYGAATIQKHSGRKGSVEYRNTEAGLHFSEPTQMIYVQCAAAMPAIRAAIAELPHEEYWARKIERKIDADGDICTVQKWEFDDLLCTEAGSIISEREMESYLDSKGITEIEIADAVKMWADEKEATRIKANEAGNARAKAMFEADEVEVGYHQACENAGIPRGMR